MSASEIMLLIELREVGCRMLRGEVRLEACHVGGQRAADDLFYGSRMKINTRSEASHFGKQRQAALRKVNDDVDRQEFLKT